MPRLILVLSWAALALPLSAAETPTGPAGEWTQWGGSAARNNVAMGKNLPCEWSIGQLDRKTGQWAGPSQAKHVRWVAKLGNESYGSPVIAGGKVFLATNNAGYSPRYPLATDLGCVLAFRVADGQLLWQYSAEKLKAGRDIDYPHQGICSTPVIEGHRLWIVTNRSEVVCLDTEGFGDGKNDGPFQAEPVVGPREADVVWAYDMMKELGTVPRYMTSCSPTTAGDLLLTGTSNGVNTSDEIPAPKAPSFLALDKLTGKRMWADNSPGANLLDGQWSSPAFAVLGDVPQAIFAGGDGWLYSFEARASTDGKAKLLWKFDCNPKDSVWEAGGAGRRNNIISSPVICDGRVYLATGQDPEAGEGAGDLWCIDPTRKGDVSAELVVDGEGKPVPPQRTRAMDKAAGHRIVANPNSAAVWHYCGKAPPDNEKKAGAPSDFKTVMHRSVGMPAIKDGLLVIGDFSGLVHCLDAKTGKVHWTHDMLSAVWGSPLIADGKVYLGNEDGDVVVFEHAAVLKVLGKNNVGNAVYGTPAVAGKMLFVSTRAHLIAISADQP